MHVKQESYHFVPLVANLRSWFLISDGSRTNIRRSTVSCSKAQFVYRLNQSIIVPGVAPAFYRQPWDEEGGFSQHKIDAEAR